MTDLTRHTKGMPWLTNSKDDGVPLFQPPKYEWYETPEIRLMFKLLTLMNMLGAAAFLNGLEWSKLLIVIGSVILILMISSFCSRMKLHTLRHILMLCWFEIFNHLYLFHGNPWQLVLLAFIFTVCMITWLRFRFYVFSYFHDELYELRELSKTLGIIYQNDLIWKTNRDDTQIYMDGFFVSLIKLVTGMEFVLPLDVKHGFMKLQKDFVKDMDLSIYFFGDEEKKHQEKDYSREGIMDKTFTLFEFENYLSRIVLRETNRAFQLIDKKTEEDFAECLLVVRIIMNGLTTDLWAGYRTYFKCLKTIWKISRVLKSIDQHRRLLLHVPQLALIHNFSKYIARTNGDMSNIQVNDFLDPISKYFILIHKGQLCFVDRHVDNSQLQNNRSFGPYGLQCPGASYSFEVIHNILSIMKKCKIQLHGEEPKYYLGRFTSIVNKEQIKVTFTRKTS